MMQRGRGMPLRPGQRPGQRPAIPAGPRPSFQYRNGDFICDICKKGYKDGNDMVAHWKSHVKQLHGQARGRGGAGGRGRPGRGGGASKTHLSSKGRPITSKSAGKANRGKGAKGKAGGADKGRARWTAYLLWSTRRRKEITKSNP